MVTNKHIALTLGDYPFSIRLNNSSGGCDIVLVESTDESRMTWYFHSDSNVDLAVAPFSYPLRERGNEELHLPSRMLLTQADIEDNAVGVGDIVHTVGMFRFMAGNERNVPIVFTGNVAMLPSDEPVPVEDWDDSNRTKRVHAFLIEGNGIEGMSGSPVFVRKPGTLAFVNNPKEPNKVETAQLIGNDLMLLGVWSNSFAGLATRMLSGGAFNKAMIPVGVGVVVPSSKLLEIFESKEMTEKFSEWDKNRELASAARKTIAEVVPQPSDESPTHREDFRRLVDAAAKTPPQDDQT
ncbi:MAG: hypothetical protein ACT4SY_14160 [Hyphomicrobiales bacterium]